MSKSKDGFGGHYAMGGTGRARWRDASRMHRCPVCSGDSWCQISRDGSMVLCKRCASDDERENREGVVYYVHRLDGSAGPRRVEPPPLPSVLRASEAVLDRVYRALLARLELWPKHRDALRARGLGDADIAAAMYCTLPQRGRAAVARAMLDAFDEETLRRVPGFFVRHDEANAERWWWTLGGWAGLLVPCVDVLGRVTALKVRADDPQATRYTYVSSARHDGPAAMHTVHVPPGPRAAGEGGFVVRVSEGEIKGHVATVLSGVLTVSVPGIGNWRGVLPVLERLRPDLVLVAADADYRDKPEVARAARDLVRALRVAQFRVRAEVWDPSEGKGIDDKLLRDRARGAA